MNNLKLASSLFAAIGMTTASQAALVASFSFEEGSGTVAIDSSGSGNDGTIAGGATWAPGILGSAISLDGIDDTIRLNDNTFAGNTTITSISAWVFGGVDNPERSTFFWGSNVTTGGGTGRQQQIHLPWENGISYWRAPSGQIAYTADAGVVAGSWNHWAFTKDSTDGDIKIYLNGAEVASGTGAGVTTVAASWLGSQGGDDRFYHGLVDEFKVYDHELSQTEVSALAAVPEPSSALLAFAGLALGLRRRR
ncbi:MAG: LamG domain-containing protein [Verrucomicrobiaceae bacterium]